jgi:DNA-binding MarR family transcriptional regulator
MARAAVELQSNTLADKLGGAPHGKDSVRLELRLLTCAALIERRIAGRFRDAFQTTLPRFDFMAALDRHGPMSLGEVSRMLMVTNGNVTGLATRLKLDGLIENCAGGADRRTQFVRLTAEGQRRFTAMATAHEGWIEAMFSDLNPGEREDLLRLLDRAKHSLREEASS